MSQNKPVKAAARGQYRQRSNSVGNMERTQQQNDMDGSEGDVPVFDSSSSSSVNMRKRKFNRIKLPSNTCVMCELEIPDEGERCDSVICDSCGKWVCLQCSKIPAEVYAMMNKGGFENLTYNCPPCKKAIPCIKNISDKIEKRFTSMETKIGARFENLEKTIDKKIDAKIETKLVEMVGEVSTKIITEVRKDMETVLQPQIIKTITDNFSDGIGETIREEVKQQLEQIGPITQVNTSPGTQKRIIQDTVRAELGNMHTAKPTSPGTQKKMIQETIKLHINEQKEKDMRKNNIIIYKAKEPETNVREDVKREDKLMLMELCNQILGVEVKEADIGETTRIGKKEEDKCRPLLVKLQGNRAKPMIFRNLNKLRKYNEENNKQVAIADDLTKEERKENKKLIQLAKDMTSEDPTQLYKVRGPPWDRKIVPVGK